MTFLLRILMRTMKLRVSKMTRRHSTLIQHTMASIYGASYFAFLLNEREGRQRRRWAREAALKHSWTNGSQLSKREMMNHDRASIYSARSLEAVAHCTYETFRS